MSYLYFHFPDNVCWFNHNLRDPKSEFKCGLCGKILRNKSDFMRHRIWEHTELVEMISMSFAGDCWFKQRNSEQIKQSTKMKTSLFEIMESVDINDRSRLY